MEKYLLSSPKDYKIINQTGYKQYVFPLEFEHNAIWDGNVTKDGVLYFPLCTEITTAGYAKICKYEYATNEVTELFKMEDVVLPSHKAIRASKTHTSIHEMNDGRLVMTTHTTDKSPLHPMWMPYGYYHHVWEGFAGSNIVVYDRKTNKPENLGIPVPHESIYGAIYDPKHDALFFAGFFRGHVYRYDFATKRVHDFGQMTENFTFRLVLDKNGDVIASTRSGYVYKINTETLEVKDLNYRTPFKVYPKYTGGDFKEIANGKVGPDGRLYFFTFYGRQVVALDSDTDTFEVMGDYMPGFDAYSIDETRNGVIAMDFDSEGVLWYSVYGRNCSSGIRELGIPASLFRWDIARGGKPEWMGVIGTKERAACWTGELSIDCNDILYVIGTNHAMDGPDINAIDLKQYRKEMYNFGDVLNVDPYYARPMSARYEKAADEFIWQEEFGAQNVWTVPMGLAWNGTRLWRALAPDKIPESSVKAIAWEDAETLVGVCGKEKEYVFKTVKGQLVSLVEKDQALETYQKVMAEKADLPEVAGLPNYPGRQYLAKVAAAAKLGEKTVVGTKDGMLAVCNGDKVFGLGPAAYNGPVRDLAATPDGKKVYGVAGHDDDLGVVFSYDEEEGLRWLGHVTYAPPCEDGAYNLTTLSACAVSPDGKCLAVANCDRLGQILYYAL